MKNFFIFLIILSVIAGAFLTVRNDLVEVRHRDLEIVVDHTDVQAMAREAVITDAEMFTRLRDIGVTAVGLREAAVVRYRREGTVAVIQGSDILNNWRTGVAHPQLSELIERGDVSAHGTYLVTDNPELAERLRHKAELKLKKPVRTFFNSAPYVIEVMDDINRVVSLRVGLDPQDVELVRQSGLRIVPRPDNQFLKDKAAIQETLAEFFSLPKDMLSAVIFEGADATGFPANLSLAAEKLNDAEIPFGIVEYNPRTAGLFTLGNQTGYNTVLVHSNWPNETVEGIMTAVRERRVRLLYARVNLTDPNFYASGMALISSLAQSAAADGYTAGPARSFDTPQQEPLFVLFMLLGIAAATTLLLRELIGREPCPLWLVFMLIFAGLVAVFPVLSKNLALQAVSIGTAIIFSSLAVVTQQVNRLPVKKMNNYGAVIWSLQTILRTFIFAIAGGLVILGLTSTPYFTSGIPLFRGVKIVHTIPLFIVALAVAMRVSSAKPWTVKDMVALGRQMLSQPILLGYLLLITLLGAAAFIYMGRTGHTAGIPVPAVEQQMRLLLGEFLLVRPRLKEFMFGYPLSLLGLILMAKGYRNIISAALVTFGAVATVSVVNTFMHFTTPGYVTVLRSINGLWLGLVFGLLVTAAFFLAERLVKKIV